MAIRSWSRRDFLARGTMAAGAALAASSTATVQAASAGGSGPSAHAAGTILIGGDLRVNRLGYGAMRLTGEGDYGPPKDPREARAVLRRAVELGVNFIDTADSYGPHINETLIYQALYPYPRGLVITTKGGFTRPNKDEWTNDARPEHLRQACEQSLQRLKLERIELYQLHEPDPKVPLEDSLGELARLQKEGKIHHIGLSNVNIQQLTAARKMVKVVSVENHYNVADRESDEVLAACEREHMVFIPWGPLAQRRPIPSATDPRLIALSAIAKDNQLEVPQAAVAWLLARSPVMLPIPGTSRADHLEQNVAAAKVRLTKAEMKRIG
jgi:pyridoxine 4-dehydrogenase